ncbi:conserved hypothetical protein, secreted, partial [Candidatus Magnetomorum sp. HK-1]
MTTIKQMNLKKGIKYFCAIIFFLSISAPSQAIEWTYYDIEDNAIQNPTQEEIQSTAVMRVSDTGQTQYSLEISHDFSGTWGTGYLENIGNPTPGVGKHWMNLNEEVTCNVDGIVQDVYNMNSRYIVPGYYAQGPPNYTDKASALVFDGDNDNVSTTNVGVWSPWRLEYKFWAKRDRSKKGEWMLCQNGNGFYMGFDAEDKAVFGIPSYEIQAPADKKTDNAWHHWKLIVQSFWKGNGYVTGRGFILYMYRDNVLLASKAFNPDFWTTQHGYWRHSYVKKCKLPHTSSAARLGGYREYENDQFYHCKNEWGWGYDTHSC